LSRPIAVRFENVHKSFIVNEGGLYGFKELILNLPQHLKFLRTRNTFAALNDITFDIKKGEAFGIIGRNGSGKSTTLGLIAGVLKANAGSIQVNQRVSPLLELGAGFHPELSGEMNIFLNGILLGMTKKQVTKQLDAIIDFAELADFICYPLRTYSSGMIARLGFSVAVHLEPELLLIDEVLAVGDEHFQKKCMKKMGEFHSQGITMVFVSHNLDAVEKICDRAALLDSGYLVRVGRTSEVIAEYLKLMN